MGQGKQPNHGAARQARRPGSEQRILVVADRDFGELIFHQQLPHAGVLFFQARDNTRALAFSGNAALGVSGTVYAPKALVALSGNAVSKTTWVVDSLTIPGHGSSKINAAYALGGPKLSVKTIKALLNIRINHVVNVNFGGFRRAVNRLGCVYADIDRKYFNDNHPPAGGGPNYAVIDIEAGYQKLCGQDALDYVRYRHFDTDLVRAARQQEIRP